jgi:hypothetical protein
MVSRIMELMNLYRCLFCFRVSGFFAIALKVFDRKGGLKIGEFKHRRRRRTSNTGNPKIPEPALVSPSGQYPRVRREEAFCVSQKQFELMLRQAHHLTSVLTAAALSAANLLPTVDAFFRSPAVRARSGQTPQFLAAQKKQKR